uniref:Reverse transcriptase domain-containing protein n=1 Tax=Tanacetum cinerariifolium TaxID=118510 RepID=A0A6L2KR71_TANCI|nr:hypothetical protein [Tanacetum cinerariifolium]
MLPDEPIEEDSITENVIINNSHSGQPVVINIVPRFVMERRLKAYPLVEPKVQKKRGLNTDQKRALKEKEKDGSWWVNTDFASLNKVCLKDMYPFPEADEKLESLMRGYDDEGIFRWTKRAEKALQDVKDEMGKLSTLVIPKENETLMVVTKFLAEEKQESRDLDKGITKSSGTIDEPMGKLTS